MSDRRMALSQVAQQDDRFAVEAYEFLCQALPYTYKMLGIPEQEAAVDAETQSIRHVTGQELSEGVRRFALEQFGMMAYTVLRQWGIHSTSDIGEMVYRLIDGGLWRKSESDRKEDFDELYDFAQVFVHEYRIDVDEL
jgi:uncharacterized repeat protein (TIGR04138 family)